MTIVYIGCALLVVWAICFIVALIVCKRRLVLDGDMLRLSLRKEVAFERPIEEIDVVMRGRFSR